MDDGKKKKVSVQGPDEWPWEAAKKLLAQPDVTPAKEVDVEWHAPDIDGLVNFLVEEKGFKCVASNTTDPGG